MINISEVVKPKRGRRSKKEIEAAAAAVQLKQNSVISIQIEETDSSKPNFSKLNTTEETIEKTQATAAAKTEAKLKEKPETKSDAKPNTITEEKIENTILYYYLPSKEIEVNKTSDSLAEASIENEVVTENIQSKPPGKKRGRKPKGGKIIQQIVPAIVTKPEKPNVILHLKCSIKDLQLQTQYETSLEPFHFSNNKNELNYDVLCGTSNQNFNNTMKGPSFLNEDNGFLNSKNNNTSNNSNNSNNKSNTNTVYHDSQEYESDNEKEVETKQVWKKLKNLQNNLHINNISDKKSACFWCTFEFDNPPIYIPKHYIKDSYQVYGCFCSPECGVAHLMEENIDSSTKFERYHLLNHIYAKVYDYKKNIKPAPNPYYMLDKYYGNLNIQEYRSLLRNERFFLIVDKPLTRILPELHEDNEDHIINNKIIPSNTFQIKKKLQRKNQTKNNILNEKFGMQSSTCEQ